MRISIHCKADGEPIVTSALVEDYDGVQTPIEVDYVCWEWSRGHKPMAIIGVGSEHINVQADIEVGGPRPPILKT